MPHANQTPFSNSPNPGSPARQMAAHVQKAVATAMQAKVAAPASGGGPMAPHVQAAIAAGRGMGQAKMAGRAASERPVAAHVQAAVAGAMQTKVPRTEGDQQQVAAHVQAAAAGATQAQRAGATQQSSLPAVRVEKPFGVAQPKGSYHRSQQNRSEQKGVPNREWDEPSSGGIRPLTLDRPFTLNIFPVAQLSAQAPSGRPTPEPITKIFKGIGLNVPETAHVFGTIMEYSGFGDESVEILYRALRDRSPSLIRDDIMNLYEMGRVDRIEEYSRRYQEETGKVLVVRYPGCQRADTDQKPTDRSCVEVDITNEVKRIHGFNRLVLEKDVESPRIPDNLYVYGPSQEIFRGSEAGNLFVGLCLVYKAQIFLHPLFPFKEGESKRFGRFFAKGILERLQSSQEIKHLPIVHGDLDKGGATSHGQLARLIERKLGEKRGIQERGETIGFTVYKGPRSGAHTFTFTSASSNAPTFPREFSHSSQEQAPQTQPTRDWAQAIIKAIDRIPASANQPLIAPPAKEVKPQDGPSVDSLHYWLRRGLARQRPPDSDDED